jgi:hypothetical protein
MLTKHVCDRIIDLFLLQNRNGWSSVRRLRLMSRSTQRAGTNFKPDEA